ncbi:MAG: phage integrase central domain-containing protein [Acidimicrobiales bacterium]
MASKHRTRRAFGSVRRLPSGRYQATYWHNGKQFKGESTFGAKADAHKWLTTVEADLRRGKWIEASKAQDTTSSEYAQAWIARRSGTKLRTTTEAKYRGLLDRHILPTLGDRSLSEIDPDQVEAWYYPLKRQHPSTAAGAYRSRGPPGWPSSRRWVWPGRGSVSPPTHATILDFETRFPSALAG